MKIVAEKFGLGRDGKMTLAPLVRDGRNCLACADVEGIEKVTLREVEFYYQGKPWQQIVRRSDDVFELVESGILEWPTLDRIARAKFEVRFRNVRRACRVTVDPARPLLDSRNEAWPVLAKWLLMRRFMEGTGNEEGTLA